MFKDLNHDSDSWKPYLISSFLCQLDQSTQCHFSSLWKSRPPLSSHLGVRMDNFPNFLCGVFWYYHVDNTERCTVLGGNDCSPCTHSHSMATTTMGSHLTPSGCTALFIPIAQAKATETQQVSWLCAFLPQLEMIGWCQCLPLHLHPLWCQFSLKTS